ncbi:MAG: hypothetical protein AB7R55_02290 [Gemmatimonadales bacterium]
MRPADPVILLVVSMVMVGIGLAARRVPALRAARIDPGIAMRPP